MSSASHGVGMRHPTVADLLELVELIDTAPYAAAEIDALLALHYRGRLSIEAVKHWAQHLVVLH